MRQARRRIDRASFYSSKAQHVGQPGPAIVRAGNGLAVICLSFGAAFAALASSSLEQRIGNLFFLGFIPAVAESWSRKSVQDDKWSFCLTAGTLWPANQERQ